MFTCLHVAEYFSVLPPPVGQWWVRNHQQHSFYVCVTRLHVAQYKPHMSRWRDYANLCCWFQQHKSLHNSNIKNVDLEFLCSFLYHVPKLCTLSCGTTRLLPVTELKSINERPSWHPAPQLLNTPHLRQLWETDGSPCESRKQRERQETNILQTNSQRGSHRYSG